MNPDISEGNFLFFSNSESLAEALADELGKLINESVAARGICHMVFPGGRSPHLVLKRLRGKNLPWKNLHLYPSDERCVPLCDPERNDRLIDELIFNRVPLPEDNLHRIPAELGPEEGARQFSILLDRTPCFDIALLGMGSDGHTASLFPEQPAMHDRSQAVPVFNSPKPPSSRVSISLNRLAEARNRLVIVLGGADKIRFLNSLKPFRGTPVELVQPTAWYIHKEIP
jgi:6-phosphogluconolactonase